MADHPDLPQPKYRVGQTLYYPHTVQTQKSWPCPDCSGTRKWVVKTPAGATFSAECRRCGDYRINDLPPLKYLAHEPQAVAVVIDGIEVSTAPPSYGNAGDLVKYIFNRRSGSHNSMWERQLFEREEDALLVARINAAEANAKEQETPAVMACREIAGLTLEDATFKLAKDGLWNSWWSWRHLLEDVEGSADPEASPKWDSVEALQSHLKWFTEISREYHPHVLEKLVDAAREGDVEKVKAIGDEVAQMIGAARAEHAAAKPAEESDGV